MRLSTKVALFYGLALLLSWSYWGAMFLLGLRVEPGSDASHLPGLMGPMIAAGIVIGVTEGRAGFIAWLRRFWRWPRRPVLTAILILAPLLIAAMLYAFEAVNGRPLPSLAALTAYPGVPQSLSTLAGLAFVLVLNGYGEEAGWRGFLFAALEAPLGRFRAVLVTIPLWLFWHLPLFFIHANMQSMIGPTLIGWAIGLALGAFVLAHLYVLTGGSLLAVVLWHVAYNFTVATEGTSDLVAAGATIFVMLWGTGVAFAWGRDWWRATRRDQNAARPPG